MSTHNICFRREIRKISAFSDEESSLSVVMGIRQKVFAETLLMSTLNTCFRREIHVRKISAFSDEKSALSVAMGIR